jgi:hypothetical protein
MNIEVKQKWVEALKSGEYIQGSEYLCNNNKHCCLGVLTDLYVKENNLEWNTMTYDDDNVKSLNNECTVLPDCVIEWADLPNKNPYVFCNGKKMMIAEHNDGGVTFEELAQIIEEQL